MNIVRVALSILLLCTAVIAFYLIFPTYTETSVNDPFPTVATGTLLSEFMENIPNQNVSAQLRKSTLFEGEGNHQAEGVVLIVELDDGSHALRFENFRISNGPSLQVYISTNEERKEWQQIGMLKASTGNQNYRLPNDVDVQDIAAVLVHCGPFNKVFGKAVF